MFAKSIIYYLCSINKISCNVEDIQLIEFLPDITNEHQLNIFEEYCNLINSEKKNLINFRESCISFDKLKAFNRSVKEEIKFFKFTIDFGGSSLKITTVQIEYLNTKIEPEFTTINQKIYQYADEDSKKLEKMCWYEWVAIKIKEYISEIPYSLPKEKEEEITAALTFSFPLKQKKLASGIVTGCSKPFPFSRRNFINYDVVKCLNTELKKLEINLRINCVINDVVATYVTGVACEHENPVALIVGTGTNSGFSITTDEGEKIINAEMALFESQAYPLDKATIEIVEKNIGNFFPLEVTIAGMCFVDIVNSASNYFLKNEGLIEEDIKIDLNYIKKCLLEENLSSGNSKENMIYKLIRRIVLKCKERAYSVLVPILLAASQGKSFTLIVNGTIMTQDYDFNLLKLFIQKFIDLKFPDQGIIVKYDKNNSATLYGAAFVSLVYHNNASLID